MTVLSHDEAETAACAASLAKRLEPGDVVLLSGVLGAGKTTFVRGALRAMGWEGAVRSPSFSLVNEFDTSPPVLHFDLYRLEAGEDLGVLERMTECVSFVEWGERDPGLGAGLRCWHVTIEIVGAGRQIAVAEPIPA
ncbi:MAG: tRNA (adenosine(37)-N6)-threonylcarbamoyltransferase complex ATPase subunit type 1 TsaE [Fimbriimonadaceae bacterium]